MAFITIRFNIISRDQFDITWNYLQNEFLFDVIATFPTMISNHSSKLMFLRLFHIIHFSKMSFMLDYFLEVLIHHSTILRKKANVSIRISYLILLGVHFCVILWLLVGTRQAMSHNSIPWIKKNLEIESHDNYQQYVLSIYWIFTLVTTVGYGDFYGSTTLEYFISILFEFGGFIVLAGIFWLMVQLLERDYDFLTFLSEKQTYCEHWLS